MADTPNERGIPGVASKGGRVITDVAIAAPLRRLGLRQSREELFRSERLKNLLEEFGLWTAVWTGFPVADELRRAQAKTGGRPESAQPEAVESPQLARLIASRGSGPQRLIGDDVDETFRMLGREQTRQISSTRRPKPWIPPPPP